MKKIPPLFLALLSIAVFLMMIVRHEWHLANSQRIYVELQPVDPRSLIQGDYMALNYELYFGGKIPEQGNIAAQSLDQASNVHLERNDFYQKNTILSYVQLDASHKVIGTYFNPVDAKRDGSQWAKLRLKNPKNTFDGLYPAARSFLFAEGLEPCYRSAKYAELKVQDNGQPLLVALVGEQLEDLKCEQQQTWWHGPKHSS
jgi:uncharacterized membrane-anchored protein